MTQEEHQANWNDPRSITFRAMVRGWALTQDHLLKGMANRAQPYAWLPEHFDTLAQMRSRAEGNTP